MITPETMKFHPTKELNEICQKQHFDMKKHVASQSNGVAAVTIEVLANGKLLFKHTSIADDRKTAKKLACKEVLKPLKEYISRM